MKELSRGAARSLDPEDDEGAQKYFSDAQLAKRYDVDRSTIWRWSSTGRLPRPVQLSPGTTRWRADEIRKFEAERNAAR